jgi:hypothetical protein
MSTRWRPPARAEYLVDNGTVIGRVGAEHLQVARWRRPHSRLGAEAGPGPSEEALDRRDRVEARIGHFTTGLIDRLTGRDVLEVAAHGYARGNRDVAAQQQRRDEKVPLRPTSASKTRECLFDTRQSAFQLGEWRLRKHHDPNRKAPVW